MNVSTEMVSPYSYEWAYSVAVYVVIVIVYSIFRWSQMRSGR